MNHNEDNFIEGNIANFMIYILMSLTVLEHKGVSQLSVSFANISVLRYYIEINLSVRLSTYFVRTSPP